MLQNVRTLDISRCMNIIEIPFLKCLKKIRLNNNKITSVKNLHNVENIYMDNIDFLIDVTPLKNIKTMDILQCNIENVQALNICNTLIITNCAFQINLNDFYHTVNNLKITRCSNVLDNDKISSTFPFPGEKFVLDNCNGYENIYNL